MGALFFLIDYKTFPHFQGLKAGSLILAVICEDGNFMMWV